MAKEPPKRFDKFDDDGEKSPQNELTPSNSKKIPKRQTAVALQQQANKRRAPMVTASGRGKVAEKILQMAFENDIKVREDSALAEMLAQIDLDSPIPSEAFVAVAEILTYVYRANGQPNPFDSVLEHAMDEENDED